MEFEAVIPAGGWTTFYVSPERPYRVRRLTVWDGFELQIKGILLDDASLLPNIAPGKSLPAAVFSADVFDNLNFDLLVGTTFRLDVENPTSLDQHFRAKLEGEWI